MVRFKVGTRGTKALMSRYRSHTDYLFRANSQNRWLLVEFIFPSKVSSAVNSGAPPIDILTIPQEDEISSDKEDSEDPSSLPSSFYSLQPSFIISSKPVILSGTPSGTGGNGTGGGEETKTPGSSITEKQIWGALKDGVMECFGDAGWGKVGSNMAGEPAFLHSLVQDRGLLIFLNLSFDML